MSNVYDQEPEARNIYYVIPAEIMDSDIPLGHKILYALLSGFAHKNGDCYPSDEYLGKRLNCSGKTAGKWIADLTRWGYITKKSIPNPNNPFHKIRIISMVTGFKKSLRIPASEDTGTPASEDSGIPAGGGIVSEGTSIYPPSPPKGGRAPKESASKTRYEDHVFLSDKEKEALDNDLGKEECNRYIKKLDAYIGSTGKKYKSHYKTIISWNLKDQEKTSNDHKSDKFSKKKQVFKENIPQWMKDMKDE